MVSVNTVFSYTHRSSKKYGIFSYLIDILELLWRCGHTVIVVENIPIFKVILDTVNKNVQTNSLPRDGNEDFDFVFQLIVSAINL